MKIFIILLLFKTLARPGLLPAQNIPVYYASKTSGNITIDRLFNEKDWKNAPYTEPFVLYLNGEKPVYQTKAKMLWDKQYLYIGFFCEDNNVQATITQRDGRLFSEDVVEIFCDPDGNGKNYMEIQINPLNTVTDMLLNKPYSEGGRPQLSWDMEGLKSATHIMGTLNDPSKADTAWFCEAAMPFEQIFRFDSKGRTRPSTGDTLRILLTRYQYFRSGQENSEISSWNQTDRRGFHAPDKYGIVILKE